MKERPILFSCEMARAIAEGRKTQTRREISAATWRAAGCAPHAQAISQRPDGGWEYATMDGWEPMSRAPVSPYGMPGDRLWVKETFATVRGAYVYRANGDCEDAGPGVPWKPSLFMPRVASRLLLEIMGVRAEQLQAITPADALAEGVFCPEAGYAQNGVRAPVLSYAALWEDINGLGAWERNPWVWVITFRRIG